MLTLLEAVQLPPLDENPELTRQAAMLIIEAISDEPNPTEIQIDEAIGDIRQRITMAIFDDEGEILAVGGLQKRNDHAEVVEVATVSNARNLGLGRQIMFALEQKAQEQAAATIRLTALGPVRGFYERLNYQKDYAKRGHAYFKSLPEL